jgi:hypothetical protein
MVLERMMELVRERARVRALRSADPATAIRMSRRRPRVTCPSLALVHRSTAHRLHPILVAHEELSA